MADSEDTPHNHRNYLTFGSGDGAPSADTLKAFRQHAFNLYTDVALAVDAAFLQAEHDFSDGSDSYAVIEGMITQCAAEVFAADRIISGGFAVLTAFHHVRALYEAHATVYWVFQDWPTRSQRLLRETLILRAEFEEAFRKVGWSGPTDLTAAANALITDDTIKRLPNPIQRIERDAILEKDYPLFWKFASSHMHPFAVHSGEVDTESERILVEQIMAASIRHCAAIYRHIADHFSLPLATADESLGAAERWAAYA